MIHLRVTESLRGGIVLWDLQEQKCQQHVSQHTDVVQTGQVGWMVLILQWEMVKFPRKSALVIATPAKKYFCEKLWILLYLQSDSPTTLRFCGTD